MRMKEIGGSRAGDITAAANVLDESRHQAAVKRTLETLTEAERRAKTASQPQLHLVSYRIESDDRSPKGTESQRRRHLVTLIQALPGAEKHLATSTWLVRSHRRTPSLVRDSLTVALDAKLDFLSVAPLSDPPAAFGDAKLQSD